ncbi:MAG: undecaprenyl-phosphate alpha-N-acetylglucosaminyl 1-phosphate transferase [Thiobacillus sp.]|nr:undecaprenyl-phosphate alpha-N-acetylglucosaminyl 1-phosphate transferase [Thiobacillus sp.]
MNELSLLHCLALPVTALLIVLLRHHAPRLGVVDVPGGRKHHHGDIPLVGGLGMFGGLALIALLTGSFFTAQAPFFAAMSLLVITGFLDDRDGLSPRIRFALQAVAALIMVYGADVRLTNFGDLFGLGDVTTGRFSAPITVFAVLGVINAINMIDGVDGLAGGVSLIALLVFSAFAAAGGFLDLTLLSPLVCAVAGFMLFNLRTPWRSHASVFMGDVGSVLLGFSLAWYAVDLAQARHAFTPITAIWILAIPLMDTTALMIRRVRKGRSPFSADREHLHHILLRAGFTPGQTVAIVYVLSLLLAAFGVAGWSQGVPEYMMFYSFMALFGLYYYGVHRAWKLMKQLRRLHDGVETLSHIPETVRD